MIHDGRVDAFHILFPDPWWKTQHRVKRLFSPPFVALLAAKLRPGGLLCFKSDVEEYGELVRYLVEQPGAFSPTIPPWQNNWATTPRPIGSSGAGSMGSRCGAIF